MTKIKCLHADLAPTNVNCPECKKGTFEVARGRYGPVYKCTNKSECNFWITERPTGMTCEFKRENKSCGELMFIGTKTIPDRCSDKTCPNRYPHKLVKLTSSNNC